MNKSSLIAGVLLSFGATAAIDNFILVSVLGREKPQSKQ